MARTSAAYLAQRARAMAYGTWRPWAEDPAQVREHVRQLREGGASYEAIGTAAGVAPMAVHALMNGGGRVRAETAGALMGLTPERLDVARVPATGTQRQVRGLVAMGHSYSRIARALGCHFETVQRLARGDVATVPTPLRADVTHLYGQWWDKRPPERTKGERSAAEASRQRAARAGWCTGAGLDDTRIDDPSYVPQASWRRAEGTGIAPDDPLGRERAHAPAQEGTAMTFDPALREATERQNGAALAHQLIVRGAEAGRSAEWLAGKHEELLGQLAPDAGQTPAEREWLAGFRDEAENTLATLRDVERADAAEREAASGQHAEPEAEAG